MLRLLLVILTIAILIPLASFAQGDSAFVDPEIEEELQNGKVRVLIVLKDDEQKGLGIASIKSRKDKIKEVQDKVINDLQNKGLGIAEQRNVRRLENAPIITTEIDASDLDSLASNPNVEAIFLDKILSVTLATSIVTVEANTVWGEKVNGTNLTGAGQNICVMDTGIDINHTTFAGKIVDQKCYCSIATATTVGCCQNATDSTNATDDHGHGTHVASIAASNGDGIIGVAKDSGIVALKVCNSSGACSLADLALAIDYCTNNSDVFNISGITGSIADGGAYATQGDCPTSLDSVIDTAVGAGILVTFATGNQGNTTGVGHPACARNSTSVGGTTANGASIGTYSNRGPLIDLVAPGSSILAANLGGGTILRTGTSMATPHVAGIGAILAQNARLRNKTFDPQLVEVILEQSAGDTGGFRLVNAIAALVKANTNLTYNTSNNSLSNQNVGTVFFRDATNISRLGDCFNITSGNITLHHESNSNCTQYNKTVRLRMEGLSFHEATPLINNTPCNSTICQNITYGGGILTFDVLHFSSYTAGTAVNLSIRDDTDNESRFVDEQVTFFANFTNSTGPVNTTDGACEIAINSTGTYSNFTNMTFNTSINQFTYNQTFSDDLNGTFNVTCTSFNETLVAIDNFEIKNDTIAPVVTLVAPANNSIQNVSVLAVFTYNVTDNTSISSCSLYLNGTLNSTDTTISKGVDQTFNVTMSIGTISWNVSCTDSGNNNATSNTFVFIMNATNTAPVRIANISNQSWPEDTNQTIELAGIFNDTDGDSLTYTAQVGSNITVVIDNSTANATLTPAANFSGISSIVFFAFDVVNANASSNNVTLNVTFVSDLPIFTGTLANQSWTAGNDNDNAFDLDNYFTDADNATLIYDSNGTSSISVSIADGQVSFSQGSSYTGTEIVTFNASDGVNTTYSNAVTLTVNAASSSGGGSGGSGGGGCTSTCSPAGFVGCSGTSEIVCEDTNGDGCRTSVLRSCADGYACSAASQACVIETCLEEWLCEDWEECTGTQTRSCIELNGCDTEDNKPSTTQECTPPEEVILSIQEPELEEVTADVVSEEEVIEEPEGQTIVIRSAIAAILLLGMGTFIWKRHKSFLKGKKSKK